MVDVSIVIACYNEEPLLADSIAKITGVMDATKWKYELIFVDDCSQDRTRKIIDNIFATDSTHLLKKIFHNRNTGRGRSVTDGMLISKGTYVGYLDIDLEVGAHYIPLMILALEKGADIAIAFRVYKETIDLFFRSIISMGYRFLVRVMLNLPIRDTETGYKFFNRKKIMPILNKTMDPGWFWDTEIMTLAYHAGLNIIENPCLFIRRKDKKSSVRVIKDSIDYFIKLIKLSRKIRMIMKNNDQI